MFIKQYDQESELYYSKLVCEVTKIEKEDIRDRRNRSL